MRRIQFKSGQRLLFHGVPITLKRRLDRDPEEWEVENRNRREIEVRSRRVLDIALHQGELLDDSELPPSKKKYRGTRAISDLSPRIQRQVRYEKMVIRLVAERTGEGFKTSKDADTGEMRLAAVLKEVAAEAGMICFGKEKKLGKSQYYEYCNKHAEAIDADDYAGGYSKRGRRDQMGPGVRTLVVRTIEETVEEFKNKPKGRGHQLLTRRILDDRIVTAVEEERRHNPGVTLRVPSDATVYRIVRDEINQHDWDLATKGRTLTDAAYRRPGRLPKVLTHPLQWCHFDETPCPIYLYDRFSKLPLGRPYLAWIVDLFSGGIVGFYLGFTPPGDLVIAQTLKHACLPKAYMADLYPGIDTPLLLAGIPKLITFDNSLQAHGNSIQQICGDLDILYDFTKPRAPWMKSLVERMFKMLEEELLRHQPGYVFPAAWKIPKKDYDPQTTAMMDFNDFLCILHKWIGRRVNGLSRQSKPSPNAKWIEGCAIAEPEFVANTADLEALFGIVREGRRLDESGVQYEGLAYYSDEVDLERHLHGARQKVAIKANPLSIRRIHVRGRDKSWIPVKTDAHPEWPRLDLHVLKLLNKQSRMRYGVETMETRVHSFRAIQQDMAIGYDDGMSAANSARAARALGIGTPLLFHGIGHDGAIPPAPSSPVRLPAPAPTPRLAAPPASLDAHVTALPTPRRAIPTFKTDSSL
ncbi:DDE-type integrase/transposase/recombinase [Aureimonas sp. ME7]|uniref:integrase catalytic domain-containing protein n=1 Tax=Aureimonas sp. ME7 TaxID=2744252 RepID=UPI0015F4B90B|nr:DDE-type integrase/transposase/recombinase [Aureimonas sp. ME7]